MKTGGKVALFGLGLVAVIAAPAFLMTGFGIFGDHPRNLSPDEQKRLQGPLPTTKRLPDGRVVRIAPDGSIISGTMDGNSRGHYG